MSARLIIAGTDTDVGKTVFAAGLVRFIEAAYFKPIQAGLAGETDTETVQRLSGQPATRLLPEVYRLRTPASPHWAAELDHLTIDLGRLALPGTPGPLVVETAGGLLVPLTRSTLQIELIRQWAAPVILCARTRLGTLNHTMLSIEALKARAIPILGVALIGDAHADNERTIREFSHVKILGRLPYLDPLDATTLAAAFAAAFHREDFTQAFAP